MYQELNANEIEIIKTIIDNEDINHNELRRIIVEKRKLMTVRMFDKAMKILVKENVIFSQKDPEHPHRLYYVPRRTFFEDHDFDVYYFQYLDEQDNQLNFVGTFYHKLPLGHKIDLILKIYHTLQGSRIFFETNNLATYGKPVKTEDHRRIRVRYDELFAILYDIMSSDRDRTLILNLLQTDTLYTGIPDTNLVNDVLDKIFSDMKEERKGDDILLHLKDGDGKPIQRISKTDYYAYIKDVKKRENLRKKNKNKSISGSR